MQFPASPAATVATVAPPPVHAPADARFFHYAGARAPERQRRIDANGVGLAVYEWGAADAPPVLLVHAALDFARTFDVFAPLITDAGFRVVSYDQRGHGDSSHAALHRRAAAGRDPLAGAAAGHRAPPPPL